MNGKSIIHFKKEFEGKIFNMERWGAPKSNSKWSHDHCEICNKEISNSKDAEHEAYTDEKDFYWICEECFQANKDKLNLKEK